MKDIIRPLDLVRSSGYISHWGQGLCVALPCPPNGVSVEKQLIRHRDDFIGTAFRCQIEHQDRNQKRREQARYFAVDHVNEPNSIFTVQPACLRQVPFSKSHVISGSELDGALCDADWLRVSERLLPCWMYFKSKRPGLFCTSVDLILLSEVRCSRPPAGLSPRHSGAKIDLSLEITNTLAK